MSKTVAKSSEVAEVKQLILGTQKHYPTGSSTLQVGGATFTVTALTQLMQDFVDNRAAVETAQAATKAKIAAERAQAPAQLAVIRAFVTIVSFWWSASARATSVAVVPPVRPIAIPSEA